MSKKLARINQSAPLEISLAELTYQGPQTDELVKFYQEMNFQSFLSKMNVEQTELSLDTPVDKAIDYTVLTADNLELVKKIGQVCCLLFRNARCQLPHFSIRWVCDWTW